MGDLKRLTQRGGCPAVALVAMMGLAILFSACAPANEPAESNTTTIISTQPHFSTPISFEVGTSPSAVVLADYNADGKSDLAVVNEIGITVSVLLNTTNPGAASPTFRVHAQFVAGPSPSTLATGDVNGDGKVDLVVGNSGNNTVSVLLNTTPSGATTPSFAPYISFPVGGYATSIALGDLNGDGKVDLAVANGSIGTVSTLLNTTVPGASPSFTSPVSFATGADTVSVAVGDFNGDGKRDVVAASISTSTVAVLLNTMAAGAVIPSFSASTAFPVTFNPSSMTLGDINGDGKLDVVTLSPAVASGVQILLNTTPPGATTPTAIGGGRFDLTSDPISVVFGDRNGDGTLDMFVASNGDGFPGVDVYDNFTPAGMFDGPYGFNVPGGFVSYAAVIAVGDLNGDGKLDVAVSNFFNNRVSVLINLGVLVLSN